MRDLPQNQKGMALLIVLLCLLIISGVAVLAIEQSLTDHKSAHSQHQKSVLFALADEPISIFKQPDVLAWQQQEQGAVNKLLAQYSNQAEQPRSSDDMHGGSVVGVGCFNQKKPADNFLANHIAVSPATVTDCQNTQKAAPVVRFWLVLDVLTAAQDWQSLPTGVSLGELTTHDSGSTITNYQLSLYSLAYLPNYSQSRQINGCLQNYQHISSCLSDIGVQHQLLVQQFEY